MENQHASWTEVSPSSPRMLPRNPRKVSEKEFLKSIETILETKHSMLNELKKSKRTIDNKLDTMKDSKSYAE